MTKIKITAEQYSKILLHEQKIRLNEAKSVISDSLDPSVELLEEGWKEVVLGIAMIMGVGLSGVNKAVAQDGLKNSNNMAQIKATLEDESKIKDLVDVLTEKGYRNAEERLAKNAEEIVKKYNKISSDNNLNYKVSEKVVYNLTQLNSLVAQGYALKNSEMSADTIKQEPTKTIVSFEDTIDVDMGTDKLFETGGFKISEDGVVIITETINKIHELGGTLISVNIESSTDAEKIPKFVSGDDPTGNIELASLRTKSISELVRKLDSDAKISHRELPNNGFDIVSTNEFSKNSTNKQVLDSLREKTSEFRYVKMTIVASFEKEETTEETKPDEVIKNYRFELIKVIDRTNVTKLKGGSHFKNKKFKCKVNKSNNNSVRCAIF